MIRGSTRVAAVIGWPIAHSRSPELLNAAFAAAELDAVMVPIGVPPAGFATVAAALREMGALGASVTTPHKLAALAACDELSPAARAIGAVNCLHVDGARLVGHNTDAPGFLDGLGFEVLGADVAILGAGGAARAVAYALERAGARVSVFARRPAEVAWARAHPWAELEARLPRADLLVDATPLALGDPAVERAAVDALPLDHLKAGARVASLVYHRRPDLLERAAARGHSTVDGRAMLVHQAARAFEIWTGRPAPVAAMEAAIK